jgi:hypothetical protein
MYRLRMNRGVQAYDYEPIEPALSAQAVTNDFQGLFHVGAVSPKGV